MSAAETDRELLELAAKAHGGIGRCEDYGWIDDSKDTPTQQWNPLTDDGDALRLAHAVGIWMKFEPWFEIGHHRLPQCIACTGRLNMADARRMIVEVAAEVAKLPPLPMQKPIRMSEIANIGETMP